jgi:hypothetical protein
MATNKLPASKKSKIEFSQIVRNPDGTIDYSWNFRETNAYEMQRLADIRESIAAGQVAFGGSGLTDPITVMEDGEDARGKKTFRIIKGHRRSLALYQLGYDGDVEAIIYPKLDRATFYHLAVDQGQQESLSVVELYLALKKSFEAGLTEADLAVSMSGLLNRFYPPSEKFKEDIDNINAKVAAGEVNRLEADKEIRRLTLNRHRGTIQARKRVMECPEVVEVQFIRRLRGGQGDGWPTDAEVKKLHTIFTEEKAARPELMITRQKPGPKFLAAWDELKNAKEEAKEENGGRRTKKFSMMSNSEVDDLASKTDSRIVRAVLWRVLSKADGEAFAKIVPIILKLEENLKPEDVDALAIYFGAKKDLTVQTGTSNLEANKPEEQPVA